MNSILIVSPTTIFPADQGDKICIQAYAEVLAEFSDVHLLIANGQKEPPPLTKNAPFKSIHHLELCFPKRLSILYSLIVRRLNPFLLTFKAKENAHRIAAHAETLGIKHIHFEFSFFAAIAEELQHLGFQVSLRLHNIETRALLYIDANLVRGFYHWLYLLVQNPVNKRSLHLEASLLGKIPKAQTLSYGDQLFLQQIGCSTFYLPPPFPDLFMPHSSNVTKKESPLRLLFLGGIGHGTTGGGLATALKTLFPSNQARSDLNLTIAGAGEDSTLDPWRSHPSVLFTGYVENTDSFWRSCDVLFAPLYVCRGVRIKVIEALSRGVCVLATQEAAYGFPPELQDSLLLYKSEAELKALVFRLQTDRNFLCENASTGRKLYKQYFSPDRMVSTLQNWHF